MFHLICGQTGAGKTTYAIQLADRLKGQRFSLDDWMATLFAPDCPQPIHYDWMIERVGRCEAQIASLAVAAARQGIASVLDLGFSAAAQRARFVAIARAAAIPVALHHLDVPAEIRWPRVAGRNAERGETFAIAVSREMFDFMEGLWEPPGPAERAIYDHVPLGRPEPEAVSDNDPS